MASSRDTSSGPDWKDVVRALLYLEKTSDTSIRLGLRAGGTERNPVLLLVASAVSAEDISPGASIWASASVSMPGVGVGDTDAALLYLVYELDKDIYRQEQGIQPPKTA